MKKRTGRSRRAKTNRKNIRQEGPVTPLSTSSSVDESHDEIRMSEVILKLAEPLLQKYSTNLERVRGIVTLAVTAWNMSMLPESNEEELMSNLAAGLPKEFLAGDVAVMVEAINMLMERKRQYFPNIQRLVIGHEVVKTEKGWDLNVSSVTATPKVI